MGSTLLTSFHQNFRNHYYLFQKHLQVKIIQFTVIVDRENYSTNTKVNIISHV